MAFFRKGIAKLATEAISNRKTPFITFVLGGPGSGKGTQCQKIADVFNFEHICAGDLLREEMSSNSQNGVMIRSIIMEGMIVPSEITINLLKREIHSCGNNNKVLIDGFPRNEENRITFERIVGVEPDLVLFFDCPEEEIVERILKRNQGRIDDNIDTIKKRLESFKKLSLPVIDHYTAKGKVYKLKKYRWMDTDKQRRLTNCHEGKSAVKKGKDESRSRLPEASQPDMNG
ncbi:UMP-CMP kinase 3-like isoform X1 [Zingiber officinale]|uniref:UMP-CMP kinase 3-like isoform X1 n=1 Tax=Zingiber officinale TaxID=94328 RepID=UPI001C4DA1D8|nr:UMP-CMP kinase 3-like isoform X1 [Zingiber officinale]XP_042444246.1 UMP-CMP kinase 3-like isoform X1 [Zingiber officinale]